MGKISGKKAITGSLFFKKKALSARPYLLLAPILLFAAGFIYYPFFRTFLYSFSLVNFKGEILDFAGMENFSRLFSDTVFIGAVKNTLKLTAIFVPLNLTLSLGLALLAARKRALSPIYETMFTMPMAVSMPAASMIFKILLNPAVGLVNYKLGLDIGWFRDPRYALWGIVIICIFMGVSFDFLLFLSAVRNVPEDIIESATLEGAGYLTRFWKILLPVISPTVLYVSCTNAILAMMTSGPVMIVTEGGPARSTTTLIYLMFTSGYQSSNYSVAACVSIVTFLLTFGIVAAVMTFERKGVHYE